MVGIRKGVMPFLYERNTSSNTGKPSENAIIARLMPDIIKGKASCWPIQE